MKAVYYFTDYVLLTRAQMWVAKTDNKYHGEGRRQTYIQRS